MEALICTEYYKNGKRTVSAEAVRREFGTDVMVNSAHAASNKEGYERESQVIRINENDLASIIEDSLK